MIEILGTGLGLGRAFLQSIPSGETAVFKGDFGRTNFLPMAWAERVTLDFTAASCTAWIINGLENARIVGGKWSPALGNRGLAMLDCRDIAVSGFEGLGTGLRATRCAGLTAEGLRSFGAEGFSAFDCDDVVLRDFEIRAPSANGVSIVGCWNTLIEKGSILGGARVGSVHPDGIQCWKSATRTLKNLTVRECLVAGRSQGVFVKEGGCEVVRIQHNTFILGDLKWFAGIAYSNDVEVTDNVCLQLPGAKPGGYGADFRFSTNVTQARNVVNGAPLLDANIMWK